MCDITVDTFESHGTQSLEDELACNKLISEKLALIAVYYRINKDDYREKAFVAASVAISKYPTAIVSGKQAKKIYNVGKSSADIIDEFLNTGHIKRLEELERKYKEVKITIDYLTSFYGVGVTTAANFYSLGIRDYKDMWRYGNLTNAQKLGVIWHKHINLRIQRYEMNLIKDTIAGLLDPYGIRWEIAGSYRRLESSSGDIDVLIESRADVNMASIINIMKEYLPATLAIGSTQYRGIFRLSNLWNGHRIDILLTQPEFYGVALLHFTGSQAFNKLIRNRALELGLSLNEYDLEILESAQNAGPNDKTSKRSGNIIIPCNTEQDVFDILRVNYLPPEERMRDITEIPTY